MSIDSRQVADLPNVRKYRIQHPLSAYTFPSGTPRIRQADFEPEHLRLELDDGRILLIPLKWIPSLHEAPPEERAKFEFNSERTGLIWDPEKTTINDEVFVRSYLGPYPSDAVRDE